MAILPVAMRRAWRRSSSAGGAGRGPAGPGAAIALLTCDPRGLGARAPAFVGATRGFPLTGASARVALFHISASSAVIVLSLAPDLRATLIAWPLARAPR